MNNKLCVVSYKKKSLKGNNWDVREIFDVVVYCILGKRMKVMVKNCDEEVVGSWEGEIVKFMEKNWKKESLKLKLMKFMEEELKVKEGREIRILCYCF